jgi:hypothetical protein
VRAMSNPNGAQVLGFADTAQATSESDGTVVAQITETQPRGDETRGRRGSIRGAGGGTQTTGVRGGITMDTRPRRIINQLLVVMLTLTLTACTTVPLGPETAAAPAACRTEEHP